MYRPAAFTLDDDEASALIVSSPLAQLVAVTEDGHPVATPVPLIRRGESLVGHLARPNPVLRRPGPALAIFTGADAYITPAWYPGKAVDGKVVPTWNYTSVQVSGRLIVHDDPDWTLQLVRDLSDAMEHEVAPRLGRAPWSVDDAPADWVAQLVRGIVGIELVDLAIAGKHKMSQNRPVDDREAVAVGLEALADPPGSASRTVATAVRATLPPHGS